MADGNVGTVALKSVSPLAGESLPKDLAKVPGMSRGFDPPGVNHSRFVVAGLAGCGKSTVMHSNPRMFILDPEGGGVTAADPQALVYRTPITVPPGEQADAYRAAVRRMIDRHRRGDHEFCMLGVDTIDKLIDVFMVDFCVQKGIVDPLEYKDGRGNAYTIVRRDIFGLLDEATRAGMGWCLAAHVTPKTRRVGEEERVVNTLAVSDSFAVTVRRECEHMLFMEFVTRSVVEPGALKVVAGKEIRLPGARKTQEVRVLRTRPGGTWQGEPLNTVKVRIPFPDKMEVPKWNGWGVVADGYTEGVRILTQPRDGSRE